MSISAKFLKILSILVLAVLILFVPICGVYADSFKTVTLGKDLTDQQKEEMLKFFGVTRNDANVLEISNEEEQQYLGEVATKEQLGVKSISCSYVEPKDKGGLVISTNNISWVTDSMIRNALITAGIKNAVVKVSAPFPVSGTAALTGILKGFENSKGGQKIDEAKKKAANEEVVVTGNLGDKIGQDKAAALINEIKKQVVKEKPKSEEDVRKIVINVSNNLKLNLTESDINNITKLMVKINSLNIDFNQIKDQLLDVGTKFKGIIGESGSVEGFANKVENAFMESSPLNKAVTAVLFIVGLIALIFPKMVFGLLPKFIVRIFGVVLVGLSLVIVFGIVSLDTIINAFAGK